ncbi:MAG TPA: undecaprenyl-diphosphatase UppP [Patescibacteria group bacterium]|nr:undecaprenyl-diphosphatase UppP [Patescibacteria group bacterium]
MELLQSFILGAVQGLTEFLPVSSSGHLILVPWFFNWKDPGLAYDVFLHGGTLLALLVYFWEDVVKLAKGFVTLFTKARDARSEHQSLVLLLLVGTIPAAVLGKFLDPWAQHVLRDPRLVAFDLAVAGILLYVADKFGKKARSIQTVTIIDALLIGCAQALALFPGVSRSGATIIAALLLGMRRPDSARYAFLLALPITFGSVIFKFKDVLVGDISVGYAVAGFVSSAVFGFFAIRYMLSFVQKHSYSIFVMYRLVLAVVVIGIFFSRI